MSTTVTFSGKQKKKKPPEWPQAASSSARSGPMAPSRRRLTLAELPHVAFASTSVSCCRPGALLVCAGCRSSSVPSARHAGHWEDVGWAGGREREEGPFGSSVDREAKPAEVNDLLCYWNLSPFKYFLTHCSGLSRNIPFWCVPEATCRNHVDGVSWRPLLRVCRKFLSGA